MNLKMGTNSNSDSNSSTKAKAAPTLTTVSDLLHRMAASCLSQRLPGGRAFDDGWSSGTEEDEDEEERRATSVSVCATATATATEESIARAIARDKLEEEKDEEEEQRLRMWEEQQQNPSFNFTLKPPSPSAPPISDNDKLKHLEALLAQVFHSVSAVKRAYRSLQHAHCPWDPHHMQLADAGIVSELRKLDTLRDRFRRSRTQTQSNARRANPSLSLSHLSLRDAVAPYEAALDDLKKELKLKEAEADNLRHKLRNSEMQMQMPMQMRPSRKGHARSHSARWATNAISNVNANANVPGLGLRVGVGGGGLHLPGTPIPELFLVCMHHVQSASKSFASHLLHLMRAARWDIPAAIQSLLPVPASTASSASASASQYPKYAMESYVNTNLFHGFEHESFYMDGSLASLLDPAAFRRTCFSQFRDMRTMDPTEMLGVLPTCQFGRFVATKYLSLISEKTEESLFGHKEQRQQVMAGTHPRTEFYAEFLCAAKALWMLHLLAFALDPAPTRFEVRKGAEFQPEFMESVLRFASGRAPAGSIVGFSVAPGFRLGNGSVVHARVYLIPGNPGQ